MKKDRSRVVAAFALAVGLAASLGAYAQAMVGGEMMGGGTMVGGMMGRGTPEPGPSPGSNAGWDELSTFVQINHLPCTDCHSYAGRGSGPAFVDIARRFVGRPDREDELARSISQGVYGRWPGYPPMPGGLATPDQTRSLALLVLNLVNAP